MDIQTYLADHHPNYSGSQKVFNTDLLCQYADGQLQGKLEDAKESNDQSLVKTYEGDIAVVEEMIAEVRNMSDREIAALLDKVHTLELLEECEDENE